MHMNVIIVDNPLQRYILDDITLAERTQHQVISIGHITPITISEKLIEEYQNQQGRTIVLFGDVYYTDDTIKEILTCDASTPLFFGQTGGNGQTGGTHDKELWAISFMHNDWEKELIMWEQTHTIQDLTSKFFNQKQFDYWLVTYREYQKTGRFRFKHHPIKFARTNFKYLDIMSSAEKIIVWLEVYIRHDSQLKGPGIYLYINGYEVYRGDLSPNLGHCHWNISQTGNLTSAKLFWPRSSDVKDYVKNVRFDLENNI